jgi:hypothetical protein
MYIRKEETRRHAKMLGRSCCCYSLPSFLPVSPSRLLPRSLHLLLVYTKLLKIQTMRRRTKQRKRQKNAQLLPNTSSLRTFCPKKRTLNKYYFLFSAILIEWPRDSQWLPGSATFFNKFLAKSRKFRTEKIWFLEPIQKKFHQQIGPNSTEFKRKNKIKIQIARFVLQGSVGSQEYRRNLVFFFFLPILWFCSSGQTSWKHENRKFLSALSCCRKLRHILANILIVFLPIIWKGTEFAAEYSSQIGENSPPQNRWLPVRVF